MSQALTPVRAEDVTVDACDRCQGFFFDRGELELFPGRPSTRGLPALARHAPGRCPKGHAVARAERGCRTCGRPACTCPACGGRLAQVPLGEVRVDACGACGGIWLDDGEFELLAEQGAGAGVPAASAPRALALRTAWEIPEAHVERKDPWRAAGHGGELVRAGASGTARHPFVCRHCSRSLQLVDCWAFDGEMYCSECRPEGAVSGGADPDDLTRLFERLLRPLQHLWPLRKRNVGEDP